MSKFASSDEREGEIIVFCVPNRGLCIRSPGRATTPVSFRRLGWPMTPVRGRSAQLVNAPKQHGRGADVAIVPYTNIGAMKMSIEFF